jgi:acyl carrier protein
MGVEDELNITIPTDGLDGITTVGEAVELIEKANRA